MNKIILPLFGLITCSVAQASVSFIDGPIGNGDFSNGSYGATEGYFTSGANLKSTHTTWNYSSSEPDWAITGGRAVADSVAGTGFGQAFLKSDFGSGWEGQTSLSFSVDWTTQSANDVLEYAVVGFKNTSTGTNLLSLSNGTAAIGTGQYALIAGDAVSFLAGGTTLGTIGSGAASSGTFTTTLSVAGTDLADYDALAIMFFSTVDGSGGQVTVDNVSLTSIPEPGSYALLAGATCLASVMISRRR
ncbi:hypothetical protein ACWPKS_09125 [Coraliomargarita sp. W4R72]